jgi:hypothetical protein
MLFTDSLPVEVSSARGAVSFFNSSDFTAEGVTAIPADDKNC